ncbi:TlpA disulfide reductase family protein [Thiomicrorhabdus sp. zzn3]|uniref:TlpA disulfide reductase family protein n=1 Tax=Thiomicrorhabdus sp. zzn3 TaxID=3039775 RepID=UPI0024362F88|nr:TlpA disulfide reductase family protein [Thiomicrorhabdus sp. zzn3]MDG6778618.1 TlpA disulfide reductase family protein [Thiomicrorhabdus sp. zzn3]
MSVLAQSRTCRTETTTQSEKPLVVLLMAWAMSLFAVLMATPLWADESLELESVSMPLQIVPASNNAQARLLWLPSEYGGLPEEKQIAQQLADSGLESWFPDLYEPLFLPPTPSAVDKVPQQWLSELMIKALEDGKPLWIVAPNKAAQLAVRGLTGLNRPVQNLALLMINPNLYVQTPQPGETAQYWPQTKTINLPVAVLQAELSPWRWRLDALSAEFQQGGSEVFMQVWPKVRDRFYFRPDALPVERQASMQLADRMRRLMALQLPYLSHPREMAKIQIPAPASPKAPRSTQLQPYQGSQDRILKLHTLEGNPVSLEDFQGQVVLLNFWASWCPPCVHEMPSMARLKEALKEQPFEILAVNLAEEAAAIDAFLQQRPVNFPVLLDPSGSAVQSWQVFAYPSTYLIDKQGRIRFALFGGTEWDQTEHLQVIRSLLQEP